MSETENSTMKQKDLIRFIFWEWIEPIGAALCIALLVMKFVMAMYIIPTGSMQPTLHGGGDYPSEGGDKVLVNKFIYRYEEPKRWDVIVFEYPYFTTQCKRCGSRDVDRLVSKINPKPLSQQRPCPQCGKTDRLAFLEKDYIKRCVGLPNEELLVFDGNILKKVDGIWTFTQKTKEAQDSLWLEFFNLKSFKAPIQNYWGTKGVSYNPEQGLTFHSRVEASMSYIHREHLMEFGDKGIHRSNVSPLFRVGDLSIEMSLSNQPQKGQLELFLMRNDIKHSAVIDFESAQATIRYGESILVQVDLPEKLESLEFSRLDGRLVLTLNEVVSEKEIPGIKVTEDWTESIEPGFHYLGDSFTISGLRMKRDIYYGNDQKYPSVASGPHIVGENEVMAMGDNSFHSSDSRVWGMVPKGNLIGQALAVILPPARMKLIK